MGELHALQHAELDQFWDRFAAVMAGPDGLMTYRYLGTHAEVIDRHHARGGMRLRRDLRAARGLQAAPLMILVADVIGILDDAIAVPAPTQMALTLLDDAEGVDEVACEGEIVHEGRTQIFSRARVVDAANPRRVIAVARDSGVVIAPAPAGYTYHEPGPGVPDAPDLPPLWQAFGAVHRPDGAFEIPELTSRIGSTSASLHHGATHVVLEAAATEAAYAAAGTDALRLLHWHVTFTARGKDGPFVTSTDVISSHGKGVTVDAELHEGARRIASASAIFERVEHAGVEPY